MDKKVICVEYRGKRFPRVVALNGGGKLCFQRDRTVLELDEYDALLLLKSNIRLTPDKFEFTIADAIIPEVEENEEDIDLDDDPDVGKTSDSKPEDKPAEKPKGLVISKKNNKNKNRR
jgi:hypothetical protein